MEGDWRPKVETHRANIVLRIKQKLEKLVARGGDDAARETKLNHIATQFEETQWRDASTRSDYTERITKKLKELEPQAAAAAAVAQAAQEAEAKLEERADQLLHAAHEAEKRSSKEGKKAAAAATTLH